MYNKNNAGANLPKDRWIEKRTIGKANVLTMTTVEASYGY